MEASFNSRVYEIVKEIPKGKVITYGQIAVLAGSPRASRIVGAVLAKAPQNMLLPCHRVVYRDGSLCANGAFGGGDLQRKLLEKEGITFLPNGKIDLSQHAWYT